MVKWKEDIRLSYLFHAKVKVDNSVGTLKPRKGLPTGLVAKFDSTS